MSLLIPINGNADKLEEVMDFVGSMKVCNGVSVMYSNAIQARTGASNKTYYGTMVITARECHDTTWKPLPISSIIGLPLVYRKQPTHIATTYTLAMPQFTGPVIAHAGETNKAFELFASGVDVGSEFYGKPTDIANCDVQFLREDRKDLTAEHMEAIRILLLRCEKFSLAGNDPSFGAMSESSFTISPKGYFECFKTCQSLLAERNRAWAIPFPVKLETPVCESCYVEAEESGKALVKCGKCNEVWYCGVGCQKKDWKLHKYVCKS